MFLDGSKKKSPKNIKAKRILEKHSLKHSFYHDVLKYLNRAHYVRAPYCIAALRAKKIIMAHENVWSFQMALDIIKYRRVPSDRHLLLLLLKK